MKRKSDEIVLETIENITTEATTTTVSPIPVVVVASLNATDPEASNESSMTNESISSRPPNIVVEVSASRSSMAEKSYAPQLKFSEDGRIIINEESLLIQRENIEPVYEGTVVEMEAGDSLTYNSYRKHHHTKKWTDRETAKFYKALSMIGTDFTMIQRLFPNRSRDEIKRKFKREEKLNQALIDRILCNFNSFVYFLNTFGLFF